MTQVMGTTCSGNCSCCPRALADEATEAAADLDAAEAAAVA
jgi:hypothetical protein